MDIVKKIKNIEFYNVKQNYKFRDYQHEADYEIYKELCVNDKCLVKMFCGLGKSVLMKNCNVVYNKNLVVYVFPSLALINQFYNDYINNDNDGVLRVCSEEDSTTHVDDIVDFFYKNKKTNKIILVTYQSYRLLMENIGDECVDVCIYDEAHHTVSPINKVSIYEKFQDKCKKQIFFTATPVNSNGIVMYNRSSEKVGDCGKMVYDYTWELTKIIWMYLKFVLVCIQKILQQIFMMQLQGQLLLAEIQMC